MNTEEQFFEGGEDDDPWAQIAKNEDNNNNRMYVPYSQSRGLAPS
jgi:hypothetical protein